jgi:hypothetical protein
MVSEIVQTFWAAMQRGEFITDAAELAGTYRKKGTRWLAAAGGVRPRRGRNRVLTGYLLARRSMTFNPTGASSPALAVPNDITHRCLVFLFGATARQGDLQPRRRIAECLAVITDAAAQAPQAQHGRQDSNRSAADRDRL